MTKWITGRTDEELQGILEHVDEVFRELAGGLDSNPEAAHAVQVLMQSESTVEELMAMLLAEADITKTILMSSLSALVNVHSLITVRDEIQRRAQAE